MPVLRPLDLEAGLRTLVVSTYQAVSGAGAWGLWELDEQMKAAMSRADKIIEKEVKADQKQLEKELEKAEKEAAK